MAGENDIFKRLEEPEKLVTTANPAATGTPAPAPLQRLVPKVVSKQSQPIPNWFDPRGLIRMTDNRSLAQGTMDLSDRALAAGGGVNRITGAQDYVFDRIDPNKLDLSRVNQGAAFDPDYTPERLGPSPVRAATRLEAPEEVPIAPEAEMERFQPTAAPGGFQPSSPPLEAPAAEFDSFTPALAGQEVFGSTYNRIYGTVGEQLRAFTDRQVAKGTLELGRFEAQTKADLAGTERLKAETAATKVDAEAQKKFGVNIIPATVPGQPDTAVVTDLVTGEPKAYRTGAGSAFTDPIGWMEKNAVKTKEDIAAKLSSGELDVNEARYILRNQFGYE